MSSLKEKYPSLKAQYFIDSESGEIVSKKVKETVSVPDTQPVVQLDGIVSETSRFKFHSPTGMREVRRNDFIENENEYKVDYEGGFLHLHPSMCNQLIEIEYCTTGGTYLSYERIFTKLDKNGTIVERLSDLIEAGEMAIEVIKQHYDLIVYMERLEADIEEAKLTIDRINEAIESIDQTAGTSLTLAKADWLVDNNTGSFYYTWTHNQGTNNYSIDFSEFDELGNLRNSMFDFVKNDVNTMTIYSKERADIIAYVNAKAYVGDSLDVAGVIADTISSVAQLGGFAFNITTDSWEYDSSLKKYKRVIEHNQRTNNFNIDFTVVDNSLLKGALYEYSKDDTNTITVYSPTQDNVIVYINSKAWTGDISNPSLINIDELVDTANKVMMTRKEREQLSDSYDKVNEVYYKGIDPLSTLIENNSKLPLSLMGDDVLQAMSGEANFTLSSGLMVNSGVEYPLSRINMGDTISSELHTIIKETVLDIKVINAKPSKVYQLAWLGNGYTGFGANAKYGFLIYDYDKATVSKTKDSQRELVGFLDYSFDKPTGVTTRVLNSKLDDTIFVITIDYSAFKDKEFISISSFGTSIMDISNYIFTTSAGKVLSTYKESCYPFSVFNASIGTDIYEELQAGIIDIKVFNAKPKKIYKVMWLGNGYSGWGSPEYRIYLNEYNEDDILLENPREVLTKDNTNYISTPKEAVVTQLFCPEDNENEDISVEMTIDYSKLNLYNRYVMNKRGEKGFGHIIDKSCYYVNKKKNEGSVIVSAPVPFAMAVNFIDTQNIDVKIPYSKTNNLVVNFNQLGVNKITHFKHVSYKKEDSMTLDFSNQVEKYEILSDWLSPYKMKAKNNVPSGEGYGGAYIVGGNIQPSLYRNVQCLIL